MMILHFANDDLDLEKRADLLGSLVIEAGLAMPQETVFRALCLSHQEDLLASQRAA
jgi:hypothetical protein